MSVTLKGRFEEIKGKVALIAGITYIIFTLFLTFTEREYIKGPLIILFLLFSLFLNFKGQHDVSISCIIFALEICAIYIVIIRLETTGIAILYLSFVVSAVCFRNITGIALAIINIAILTIYMYIVHQLGTSTMYTRYLIQITFSFSTFLCSFMIQRIMKQAADFERQKNEYMILRTRMMHLEAYQKQLVASSKYILTALSAFERGETRARVKIVDENLFPEISSLCNNILSRQEKLLHVDEQYHKINTDIVGIAHELAESKIYGRQVELNKTGTVLDGVVNELQHKQIQ